MRSVEEMDYKYTKEYHLTDISRKSFLITGGAGFIGSSIVSYLIQHGAGHVRVLDNLSNGRISNIEKYIGLNNFELIEADIRDKKACVEAVDGIEFISHQAALGSVPRSIVDPSTTNEVNIDGFLNILIAAKNSTKLRKFVYASSSSVYGDSTILPKKEGGEGNVLSPYALTKAVNEQYAFVFYRAFNFNSIGLRYFNVFGPNQDPDNPYAAVIPLFCKSFIRDSKPRIFGDGLTSRDFTFIENVVQANILSLLSQLDSPRVYNVAAGDRITLNEVLENLRGISGKNIEAVYEPQRAGDIRHSNADIGNIADDLGYCPNIGFHDGLRITFESYLKD